MYMESTTEMFVAFVTNADDNDKKKWKIHKTEIECVSVSVCGAIE